MDQGYRGTTLHSKVCRKYRLAYSTGWWLIKRRAQPLRQHLFTEGLAEDVLLAEKQQDEYQQQAAIESQGEKLNR